MDGLSEYFSGLGVYIGGMLPLVLLAVGSILLEYRFPRKDKAIDGFRWITSVGLTMLGLLIVQLLMPVTALATAKLSEASGHGLLNSISLGAPIAFVAGFLLYDLFYYAAHRIFHEVPVLWRLHRTHHSDDVVDASTAILHHPIELGVMALLAVPYVVLLGLPASSIYAHYIVAQVFAFWQHANIRSLPGQRPLSLVLTIPELHEVHHSLRREHHNTNYGAIFSVWDRLFGTLVDDRSLDGKIECGLSKDYWDHPLTMSSLLVDPLRGAGRPQESAELGDKA